MCIEHEEIVVVREQNPLFRTALINDLAVSSPDREKILDASDFVAFLFEKRIDRSVGLFC